MTARHATIDFETYSEAGCIWHADERKWRTPEGASKKSLPAVGAAAYAQHPTTEILCLAWDLHDGQGVRQWQPGDPPPQELLDYVAAGGMIEAHNATFEWWIWNYVGGRLHQWPPLPQGQLLDSAAKARAFGLPGALAKLSEVLQLRNAKQSDGTRLLNKFSQPRNPTKRDPRTRTTAADDPADWARLLEYNRVDVLAEAEASARIPELPADEDRFWRHTVAMNLRGVGLDRQAAEDCAAVLRQAYATFDRQLAEVAGGAVTATTETQRLIGWLGAQGVQTNSVKDERIEELLAADGVPPAARRALELRQAGAKASVRKVFTMLRQAAGAAGDRLHDLFQYHGARTGRDSGADVQPQNLAKAGPSLYRCPCGHSYGRHLSACPFCGAGAGHASEDEWGHEHVDQALEVIASRSYGWVAYVYGDPLLVISGCIRGLFCAAEGYDLIASDYSAIEAVVTAVLAGEEWRLETFRQGEDIYLASLEKSKGVPIQQYKNHKARTGDHHPDRAKIGKPAELGLGFGGWIGAWKQFDKSGEKTDDEIKDLILKWRAASPAVVELWGGQVRGKPWNPDRWELYGLEGMAISAIRDPGTWYYYRQIGYCVSDDILWCKLPSGRHIVYHQPRLQPSGRWEGQVSITFMGWNSNPQQGQVGWVRLETYGGKLAENCVQAAARDIMRDAVDRLEAAGYPVVLRVHDELVAEVPEGWGSVEELERIMEQRPAWAADWPITASDGWRGKRFRKD